MLFLYIRKIFSFKFIILAFLISNNLFSLDFKNKVIFDKTCNKLEQVVITTLEFGINRLQTLRTDIQTKLNEMPPVRFVCTKGIKNLSIGRFAYFNIKTREIFLSNDFLLTDLEKIEKRPLEQATIYSSKSVLLYLYNTLPFNVIFHEFLHALGIDNLSVTQHNRVNKNEKLKKDHIYSCSQAIYPEGLGLKKLVENKTYRTISNNPYSLDKMKEDLTSCCHGLEKSKCAQNINQLIDDFFYKYLVVSDEFFYRINIY